MIYVAKVSREGRKYLAEFPDAPGCQTFADSFDELAAAAKEALEGWLEAHLIGGQVPQRPKRRVVSGRDLSVEVDPALAVAVELRQTRDEAGLTQGRLAELAGVSQQQIAKLERPGGNPTIETLKKIGGAMGAKPVVSFKTDAPKKRRAG